MLTKNSSATSHSIRSQPVTIIISDLHLGGGPCDRGDDHVYDSQQLVRFVRYLLSTSEGSSGKIELIINGDFLDFAQVLPNAYSFAGSSYWCSEKESLEKLDAILVGHSDIFCALLDFQKRSNTVTVAAGNHDVDLYWPKIQERIMETTGRIHFELGNEYYSRYGGMLVIGHGHMLDPANRFKNWNNPVLKPSSGNHRLEMCPGTLFIVKFVNWLETDYPFADNIIPSTMLEPLLRKEDKLGYLAVGWAFSKFAFRHPQLLSEAENNPLDVGNLIREHFALNIDFKERLTDIYNTAQGCHVSPIELGQQLSTNTGIEKLLSTLIAGSSPEVWVPLFNKTGLSWTMSMGADKTKTMEIIQSERMNGKELLKDTAKQLFLDGAEVVVFGHTHQPDEFSVKQKKYYNPGSWTRYLNIANLKNLSLEDLKCEEDFPYQLNYVTVRASGGDRLVSEMITFESREGLRFNN